MHIFAVYMDLRVPNDPLLVYMTNCHLSVPYSENIAYGMDFVFPFMETGMGCRVCS